MGTEPLPEMLPIPIRQKLSPPVAMERDGRCLRRHSNVRVPWTTSLRGSESLHYSSPHSAVLGSSISEAETRQVWLTSPVNSHGRVLPPYSQAIPFYVVLLRCPLVRDVAVSPTFSQVLPIFSGSSQSTSNHYTSFTKRKTESQKGPRSHPQWP